MAEDTTDWQSRALKAEQKNASLNARMQEWDRHHSAAFEAGAKSGRNSAFSTISRSLTDHAARLESTGGVVESACARVLRRAAANVAHHIEPHYKEAG